jgi:cytidylate kinase
LHIVAATDRAREQTRHAAVVTVAALHGARGSVIAPRVAEQLGVNFLDRAIPSAVAERAGLTPETLETVDESPRSGVDRLVSTLARVANSSTAGDQVPTRIEFEERRLRGEIEQFVAEARISGGVVLGRAGAVILADAPGALHVYLGGSEEARVRALMELEGIERAKAERDVRAHDRARRAYVREAYGVDGDDPSLYHLMLDATALGPDACVELIVAASRLRMAA